MYQSFHFRERMKKLKTTMATIVKKVVNVASLVIVVLALSELARGTIESFQCGMDHHRVLHYHSIEALLLGMLLMVIAAFAVVYFSLFYKSETHLKNERHGQHK